MVKTHKKLCFSVNPLNFFKLFLPDQSSDSMRLPPAFLKHYSGTLPFKTTINTAKSSWDVDLKKIDDDLYFGNGWDQFVQDNSLQHGEYLVFSYNGNANFTVKIYGIDGCEKVVTPHNKKSSRGRGCSIPENNKKDENDATDWPEALFCTPVVVRKTWKRKKKEKVKTLCFEMVLKKYQRRYLTFPRAFVDGSGIEKKKSVLLENKQGNIWQVKILSRTYRRAIGRIGTSTGWRNFWDDNKLTLNNKCMFKFVPRFGNIIQVEISSAK